MRSIFLWGVICGWNCSLIIWANLRNLWICEAPLHHLIDSVVSIDFQPFRNSEFIRWDSGLDGEEALPQSSIRHIHLSFVEEYPLV